MRPLWILLSCGLALQMACGHGLRNLSDEGRFNPIAGLPAVLELAGSGYELQGIEASGVRPDGTIDLTDPRVDGSVTYRLSRAAAAPEDSPPVGAGGSWDGQWHQIAHVTVERRGWHVIVETAYESHIVWRRGIRVDEDRVRPGPHISIPPPRCSGTSLFASAVDRELPVQGIVADLDYLGGGGGQRYNLSVTGTDIDILFDESCNPRPWVVLFDSSR